eukprot:scaffold1328_cov375-Pavlova_lutheri.AAC.30
MKVRRIVRWEAMDVDTSMERREGNRRREGKAARAIDRPRQGQGLLRRGSKGRRSERRMDADPEWKTHTSVE